MCGSPPRHATSGISVGGAEESPPCVTRPPANAMDGDVAIGTPCVSRLSRPSLDEVTDAGTRAVHRIGDGGNALAEV